MRSELDLDHARVFTTKQQGLADPSVIMSLFDRFLNSHVG